METFVGIHSLIPQLVNPEALAAGRLRALPRAAATKLRQEGQKNPRHRERPLCETGLLAGHLILK